MRPRRYVLQYTSRVVCPSNAFIFSQFRTLLRNGRLATPFPSITSALFPVQRRGRGSASILPYVLPSRLSDFNSSPSSSRNYLPWFPASTTGACGRRFLNRRLRSYRRDSSSFWRLSAVSCRLFVLNSGEGLTRLSSLECAVPRFPALSLLECADPKKLRRNSFGMRSYKKTGGGGVPWVLVLTFKRSNLQTFGRSFLANLRRSNYATRGGTQRNRSCPTFHRKLLPAASSCSWFFSFPPRATRRRTRW